jgi:CMP-N-acetylneuraminic acid synthetase
MRHHSQRVPGKNYRLLDGKPLFHHILQNLLACPEINQVVVDTDSPEVAAGLQRFFPQVLLIDRPAHLRADE